MSKLTYENSHAGLKGTVIVRLEGKRIGIILLRHGRYYYRAQGLARHEGAGYASLDECKQSLYE